MDVLKRIEDLLQMRGWSKYRLSERADIPQPTISSWKHKNFVPTVVTIEKICDAMGISLAQFVVQDDEVPGLTTEETEFLEQWRALSYDEKQILRKFLEK